MLFIDLLKNHLFHYSRNALTQFNMPT